MITEPIKIIIRGPAQLERIKSIIDTRLEVGNVVEFSPKIRTDGQNKKLHAMLHELAQAEPEGRQWTTEVWKAGFLNFLGHETQFYNGINGSGPFHVPPKSSHLNTKQMADLIECIYEYGSRHGVQFHEPPAQSEGKANSSAEPTGSEVRDLDANSQEGSAGVSPGSPSNEPNLTPDEILWLSRFWKSMARTVNTFKRGDCSKTIAAEMMVKSKEVWKSEIKNESVARCAAVIFAQSQQLLHGADLDAVIAEIENETGIKLNDGPSD